MQGQKIDRVEFDEESNQLSEALADEVKDVRAGLASAERMEAVEAALPKLAEAERLDKLDAAVRPNPARLACSAEDCLDERRESGRWAWGAEGWRVLGPQVRQGSDAQQRRLQPLMETITRTADGLAALETARDGQAAVATRLDALETALAAQDTLATAAASQPSEAGGSEAAVAAVAALEERLAGVAAEAAAGREGSQAGAAALEERLAALEFTSMSREAVTRTNFSGV